MHSLNTLQDPASRCRALEAGAAAEGAEDRKKQGRES
jgi:hypothetical protein